MAKINGNEKLINPVPAYEYNGMLFRTMEEAIGQASKEVFDDLVDDCTYNGEFRKEDFTKALKADKIKYEHVLNYIKGLRDEKK
jgi:hypothetical protein